MAQPRGVDVSRWSGTIDWQALKQAGTAFSGIQGNADLNFFGGTMEDLIAYAGGTPLPPPSLEKRVENLEKWASELDAWARTQGYDGVGPGG